MSTNKCFICENISGNFSGYHDRNSHETKSLSFINQLCAKLKGHHQSISHKTKVPFDGFDPIQFDWETSSHSLTLISSCSSHLFWWAVSPSIATNINPHRHEWENLSDVVCPRRPLQISKLSIINRHLIALFNNLRSLGGWSALADLLQWHNGIRDISIAFCWLFLIKQAEESVKSVDVTSLTRISTLIVVITIKNV